MVKFLHGMDALLGEGVVFDGAGHSSYRVKYPIAPDCPWHEAAPEIQGMDQFSSATLLQDIWDEAGRRLGGVDAIDLGRELVRDLICPACAHRSEVLQPIDRIDETMALCRSCTSSSSCACG